MADTITLPSARTTSSDTAETLYNQAVEMTLSESGSPSESPREAGPSQTSGQAAPAEAPQSHGHATPPHGVMNVPAGPAKAEIAQIGQASLLRIEQLRAENIELKSDSARLRQELVQLRQRNAELERTNLYLDAKVGELHAAEKRIAELQRSAEYYRGARKHMLQEVRTAQENLVEAERRFGQTEAQLRAICQERADRITVLTEEVRMLQRGKVELEQQVESLLSYRHRAMSCMHQLTEELKRLRRENREKSRRLSEARAILQSIDRRLAESLADQEVGSPAS